MAPLAHLVLNHPALGRIWTMLQSRLVLGIGYGVAAALTSLAIVLAAYPPTEGPVGPISRVILAVLVLNMVLILGLMTVMALRIVALSRVRSDDAGARLHLRFVQLFSAAALVPALVPFGPTFGPGTFGPGSFGRSFGPLDLCPPLALSHPIPAYLDD